MVPKHTFMSEKEVIDLLDRYNITIEQLPKIYHDDPAVKDAAKKELNDPNDVLNRVVKIIRESHTAGRAEAYRLVIKRPKK
jgi:DNA-directed RNA polymerase subunit H